MLRQSRWLLTTALMLLAGFMACGGGGGSVPVPVPVVPPSALAYNSNPAVYTLGQIIPTNTASHGGGAVVGYTVAPALPSGLSLQASTGAITGTPTALAPVATYTVTASNAGGSTTAALVITVNDLAPASLAYATPSATYTVGNAIVPNAPSHAGGAVVSYAVNPSLPPGLSLDALTGVISGTPSLPTATATHTVTATNSGGSTTADLTITVNDMAPSGLAYATNPAIYTVGTAIADNVPTHSGGAVAAYSVSPVLPAGLSLHAGTGILSGTPTAPAAMALYTVTASNGAGSTTAALSLTVNPLPRFAYVANPGDSTVSHYTVDSVTGQLRNNGYSGVGGTPQAVAVDPTGKFVYVAVGGTNVVSYYLIESEGRLSFQQNLTTGTNPYAVTVDPLGRFLYVANFGSNDVSAYAITPSNGWLTPVGTVGTGSQPLSVTVDPTGQFAYVSCNDSTLHGYSIQGTTGALTALAGNPHATPGASNGRSVAMDPLGKFVYVANASGSISAYTVNPVSGYLSNVAGSPFLAGAFPISVAVEPTGRYVYVANLSSNNVSAFAINATTGALTSLGAVAAGTSPQSLIVDPTGSFVRVANSGSSDISTFAINPGSGALTVVSKVASRPGAASIALANGSTPVSYIPKVAYVANSNGGNTTGSVSAFGIDTSTGSLTALGGSPSASGWNTQGLAWARSPYAGYGPFLYMANYNPTLTGFSIAATGSLTAIAGSPFPAPSGQSAWASVVDPSGRFAYFANYNNGGAGGVSAFRLDPLDGRLVALPGSPFLAGNGPAAIAMDPAGQFLYVANSFGNSVSAYTISATTGALTRLDADPGTVGPQDFVAGAFPYSVALDPSGRFVYVANSGDGTVSAYTITAATGALTRVDADAATAGIQNFNLGRALTVTMHPSGRYAYFIKDGGFNEVLVYGIDATTGAISSRGSIGAGTNPRALTVDAAGAFAYVANYGGNSLSVYRVDPATGLLTAVAGSPFAITGATAPVAVVTMGTIQ
ncbi:MAG: beta-propeller fold lactonase family protein [Geothrix sp.]|nr:beta-propeller fold lactonase family protein [Geothrix sp.]